MSAQCSGVPGTVPDPRTLPGSPVSARARHLARPRSSVPGAGWGWDRGPIPQGDTVTGNVGINETLGLD